MRLVLQEPEYLVKWVNRAHVHNEWVKEGTLLTIARRKLLNFKKRNGDAPCNFMEEDWNVPERFVARRPSPAAPGWEVLVKWKTLGYDACTWEPEHDPSLMQPEYVQLHLQLWARQRKALDRASEDAQKEADTMREAAELALTHVRTRQQVVSAPCMHTIAPAVYIMAVYFAL